MKAKRFFSISVLFMILAACSIFTMPQAYAAGPTKKYQTIVTLIPGSASVHSRSSTKQYTPTIHMAPTANSGCDFAFEFDKGFGFTWNAWGERLNLNDVTFNANNYCGAGVSNGWWSVDVYTVCPNGYTQWNNLASGTFGSVRYGGVSYLLTDVTLLMQCVTYSSEAPPVGVAPASAWINFTVRANVNGGTNSYSQASRSYGY